MVASLSPKNERPAEDSASESDLENRLAGDAAHLDPSGAEAQPADDASSVADESVAERVAAALNKAAAAQPEPTDAEPTDAEPDVADDEPESTAVASSTEDPDSAPDCDEGPSLNDRIASLATSDGLVHEDDSTESKDYRGTIFAKLFEAETSVASPTRWSVGSSRKTCVGCSEPLPDDRSFHTALCVPENLAETQIADASAVFERRDYCLACFEASPPAHAFASWTTVLPPAAEAPKKIVNLTSLRVYFDQLGSIVARARDDEQGAEMNGIDLSPAELADLERLRYLIALFLVRKRALRWVDHHGSTLRLECKATESILDIAVPAPGATMDEATRAFEQLFG